MPITPVMIYGDDVTHVVTEEGSPIFTKQRAWKSAGMRWRRSPASAP
jgi:hypothetical protein